MQKRIDQKGMERKEASDNEDDEECEVNPTLETPARMKVEGTEDLALKRNLLKLDLSSMNEDVRMISHSKTPTLDLRGYQSVRIVE